MSDEVTRQSDEAALADYLARGGRLTSPEAVPASYRGELMRLMATFVDSELAGAAGFVPCINGGPGLRERRAAARIVLEKLESADRVLAVMSDFGANPGRYVATHPWERRLDRDADIGATRQPGDMRLNVFHYPLAGWNDAVAMNVVQGRASVIQIAEFARCSYQPLGDAFRAILPVERRHAELGEQGLQALAEAGWSDELRASLAYWRPRVEAGFGQAGSERFARLAALGLRHEPNEVLAARWREELAACLDGLGLGD